MTQLSHLSEEELIAYSMGDAADPARVLRHLEACPACAAEAECIGETLRVFSAGPVPRVELDHAWGRLRGSLPGLATPARARRWNPRLWVGSTCAVAAIAVATAGWFAVHHTAVHGMGEPGARLIQTVADRPKPITASPVDPSAAEHMASAERLLTEISHSDGSLDRSTRAEAHTLLLHNALYVERARQRGDLPEATVLEDLGRTLTTLDHEPAGPEPNAAGQAKPANGWHLRLEMNTSGLLLDLRILQQNDGTDPAHGSASQPADTVGKDAR